MLEKFCQIGDRVLVTIPAENRQWGYNPCPDGTVAEIIGFGELVYSRVRNFGLKPGFYENRSWIKIRLPDGEEYVEWSGRLDLVDKELEESRLEQFHIQQADNPGKSISNEVFIRDLPETVFWEGDFVNVTDVAVDDGELSVYQFKVVSIDYGRIGEETSVGIKYPIYYIVNTIDGEWDMKVREADLSLVERGIVWKYLHNEPIEFSSLEEEVNLHIMLGLTEEVRNSACNLYSWTEKEVIRAVKKGLVHGFALSRMFNVSTIETFLFRDADLGKRVAKATLKGFRMT